jgi:DNA-directed RNA polymerase II subunit RPB2
VASLNGVRQMATAFEHAGVYDYMEQLHELGFEKRGDEVMYDGRTGERLEGKVFLGPTYYQRLKHMVEDKIYSRGNEGYLNQLTRQPAQGRSFNHEAIDQCWQQPCL